MTRRTFLAAVTAFAETLGLAGLYRQIAGPPAPPAPIVPAIDVFNKPTRRDAEFEAYFETAVVTAKKLLLQDCHFHGWQPIYKSAEGLRFGRFTGSLNIARLIGPRKEVMAFCRDFGDVASPKSLAIDVQEWDGNSQPICMTGCVLPSIGFSVASGDMVIMEGVKLLYCGIDSWKASRTWHQYPTK